MAPKPATRPGAAATSSKLTSAKLGVATKPGQNQKPAAAKPKEPPSKADRLKRLFTSLCAQIDGGHFVNAIKTCDKILRIEPRDPDALQTKLFLLLQTDQYAPALTLIESLSEQSLEYEFGKAYSLYRLHREEEASDVLEAVKQQGKGEENRGVIHLEAQLAYREGEFQTAYDLYNTLLDTVEPHSDEQADITTNLSAVQTHLDFITSGYLSALSALPPSATESLESAPPPSVATTSSIPTSATAAPSTSAVMAVQKQTEKKPRARRIPKGVALGVTPLPDPERWIKKSERANYQQHLKRRGRGGGGGGATQGVVETPGSIAHSSGGGGGGGKAKKKGKK